MTWQLRPSCVYSTLATPRTLILCTPAAEGPPEGAPWLKGPGPGSGHISSGPGDYGGPPSSSPGPSISAPPEPEPLPCPLWLGCPCCQPCAEHPQLSPAWPGPPPTDSSLVRSNPPTVMAAPLGPSHGGARLPLPTSTHPDPSGVARGQGTEGRDGRGLCPGHSGCQAAHAHGPASEEFPGVSVGPSGRLPSRSPTGLLSGWAGDPHGARVGAGDPLVGRTGPGDPCAGQGDPTGWFTPGVLTLPQAPQPARGPRQRRRK